MAQQIRQRHQGDGIAAPNADPATVTVHVSLSFRQRRGRKVLVAPDAADQAPVQAPQPPPRAQSEITPAVRALARAFRWRKLIETGAAATVHEIANAESINPSYVSRVLRLTLLSPDIVEPMIAELEDSGPRLDRLMQTFPVEWQHQMCSSYPMAR